MIYLKKGITSLPFRAKLKSRTVTKEMPEKAYA